MNLIHVVAATVEANLARSALASTNPCDPVGCDTAAGSFVQLGVKDSEL